MKTRIWVFLACLALGACSTAIETRTAMPEKIQHSLVVDEVQVTAARSVDIEQAALVRLKTAVENGFARQIKGTEPVHVSVSVNDFKIQSGAGRFFLGALMGANYMDVSVVVTDEAGASPLLNLMCDVKPIPGGMGPFTARQMPPLMKRQKVLSPLSWGSRLMAIQRKPVPDLF